jgi:predicted permease
MRWLYSLLRRNTIESQLDQELQFHLERQVRDFIAAGLTPQEARRKARLVFGGVGQIKEECRDVRPSQWVDRLMRNLRYSLRLLARNPGFTAVIVGVLALAIGVNTAIFSIVDSVLLRPLAYRDPGRLVQIWGKFVGIGLPDDRNRISVPELQDLQRLSRCFSHIAAYSERTFNTSTGVETWRTDGAAVSASLFPMLGVKPEIGRVFTPEDEIPGRDRVVVLSHSLWLSRFGGSPDVAGSSIRVNGLGYKVVGVLPASFRFELATEDEIWTPLAFDAQAASPGKRANHGLLVLARIKPELSMEQARSDAAAITRAIVQQNREYPYELFHFAVLLSPLLEEVVGDVRKPLWVLMAAVCAVLLIACANVAALLLSRANARQREIATRVALGAGRGTLIVQLLTESLVLGAAGCAAGLGLGWWMLRFLKGLADASFPRVAAASLDGTVVAFAVGLSLLTALLFGLAPAWRGSRPNQSRGLREGARGTTGGARSQRLQRALVVAEVAISLTLLVGAGLLVRSFLQLQRVNPGFRPDNVLTMRISFRSGTNEKPEALRIYYTRVLERLSRLPGVKAAGGISQLPLSGGGSSGTVTLDTSAVPPDRRSPEADGRIVLPGYFEAMGIALIRGRTFDARDNETSAPSAVIDETMANTYWPGEDPVGKRLKTGGDGSGSPWMNVIGVVAHVRNRTLEAPSRTEYYVPHSQNTVESMSLVMRTTARPAAYEDSARREVAAVDRDQPLYVVRTMDRIMALSVARRRLLTVLLALFAGCALLLAAVGLYGVMSYAVSRRVHEIGIRIAIGASVAQILRMVVGEALVLAAAGILLGLAGSLALSRWVSSLLFEVKPGDPITLGLTAGVLAIVTLAASYIPARRASRVDPVVALRNA